MVAGDGRSGRRRRGDGNRPVVRDGAAVARAHADIRRGTRRAVRLRGDLLLPRGDLHRHLLVRMAAPAGLDALLDGYPDRPHRPRGRRRGDGGELLDEPAGRVHAQPRAGRGGQPVAGLLQPGHALRDPAHDSRGLHGGRLPGRVGLRGRDPQGAPRSLPPARFRDPVHDRGHPDSHSDLRRRHGRPGHRQSAAGQVRRDRVRHPDRPRRSRVPRRLLRERKGLLRPAHSGRRLAPGRLQAIHPGHRAGLGGSRRPPARADPDPSVLRRHGRAGLRAAPRGTVGPAGVAAPSRAAPAVMVLVARGALRPGRAGGDGVRLDRDRGRAPAVGRVPAHDHLRRGDDQRRSHRQPDRRDRRVRRARSRHRAHLADAGAPLAAGLASRTGDGGPLRAAGSAHREPTGREPA